MSEPEPAVVELQALIERIGTKWNFTPEMQALELEAIRERQAREREAWLLRARIPRRFHAAQLTEGCRETPAVQRVRAYLETEYDRGRALVLAGPTGTGKTWATVGALDARPQGAVLWYYPALCGAWLHHETRDEAMREAKGRRFLVLDDLGVEYTKDGGLVEAFLDELIWHREAEMRPTIITTNLTVDAMKQRLSARIMDRLRGWGAVYAVPGDSLRESP